GSRRSPRSGAIPARRRATRSTSSTGSARTVGSPRRASSTPRLCSPLPTTSSRSSRRSPSPSEAFASTSARACSTTVASRSRGSSRRARTPAASSTRPTREGPQRTALDERLLLAVLAQARLGEVHDLGPRLGVLQLRDLNVRGADARLLEGGGGRLGRRRGRRLDRDRRTEDLERAEAPRPEGH